MSNTMMHGQFAADSQADLLYLAVRRQHEEALRRAAMDRLAKIAVGRSKGSKARAGFHIRLGWALQTVIQSIGRWGRHADSGMYG